MKTLILAIAVLAACRTATTAPAKPGAPQGAPAQKEIPASMLQDVAGTSVETAVPVPAAAPNSGVDFENNWIFDRYGRFRRQSGGTGTLEGRRYDVVKIELPNGDPKTVFFDITENWAHWSPP